MSFPRFKKPIEGNQIHSEYDIPSDELQDLIQRQPQSVSVKIIPIGLAAGTKPINEAGFGFVIYGFSTVDQSKYSEAFINVAINGTAGGNDPTQIFPAKTGRGFRGSFKSLFLSWPVDPNATTNSAYFIIFKSRKMPWMGGEEAQ